MIDLQGVARRFKLSVDQIRLAADLLEQGYAPGFIERYRADETGQLPHAVLWALKLDLDRQRRLSEARERAQHQLPKDAQLDEEAQQFIQRAQTGTQIESALRAFRARRNHASAQDKTGRVSQLLEQMIAYDGTPVESVDTWVAQQLSCSDHDAGQLVQQLRGLIGSLLHCNTSLNERLRRTIQNKAKLSVESIQTEPPTSDKPHAGKATDDARSDGSEPTQKAEPVPEEATHGTAAAGEETPQPSVGIPAATHLSDQAESTSGGSAQSAEVHADAGAEEKSLDSQATPSDESTAQPEQTPESASGAGDTQPGVDEPPHQGAAAASSPTSTPQTDVSSPAGETATAGEASKKPLAKMTPRQRRRRWLVSVLQPLKSLKKPVSRLTAYQHLMLGRGRRSQLIKTPLHYDQRVLVSQCRDTFVNDKHPFAHWLEEVVSEHFQQGWLAKIESDALSDLEEQAQERLFETATDQLRQSLLRRPVRGHVILLVDTVGPKTAAVVVIAPDGSVLATDEVACSAQPTLVDKNVVRLGELIHQHRVTLVALTNGPARRFLILTIRELMKQSADSGLRWTMADRSGAEAYAAARIGLKELSAYNRRDRAAIWTARSLQDPMRELFKVDHSRLRLGSYQRELPQPPLKQLIRETMADCVCNWGVDPFHSRVDQLEFVPGVSSSQAQQIATLAAQGKFSNRQQLLEGVSDWPERDARQAIGLLRVFGSDETLDGTLIHPEDYRLARRLIENTDLEEPAAAPEGWTRPSPDEASGQVEQAVESSPATAVVDTDSPQQSDSPEQSAESAGNDSQPQPEQQYKSDDQTTSGEDAPSSGEAASSEAAAAPATPEAAAQSAPAAPETDESGTDRVVDNVRPEYPEEVAVESDTPPTIEVEKLAKGWQVGREKLRRLATCLHAPFADPRLRQPPVPLLTEMPTLASLRPGMSLWAVVVGVADFGAFVEIAPECSGLVHISRLSTHFVEDPHQIVQVGDLLHVWVVDIDQKKNRVALTALSPREREAVQSERDSQRAEHPRSGGRFSRGGKTGGKTGGGPPDSKRERGDRREKPRGADRSGSFGGRRGRERSDQGGRRRATGSRHGSKPVVVTSKKPKSQISKAMKEGAEPLRSFSDLMQFYEAKRTDSSSAPGNVPTPAAPEPTPTASEPESSASEPTPAVSDPTPDEREPASTFETPTEGTVDKPAEGCDPPGSPASSAETQSSDSSGEAEVQPSVESHVTDSLSGPHPHAGQSVEENDTKTAQNPEPTELNPEGSAKQVNARSENGEFDKSSDH